MVNPYLSFEIMDKESFLPIFTKMITVGTLFIYENNDGELIGTCITKKFDRRCSHIIQITTLATNPKFFRQGFGSQFIRALISQLRQDSNIKRIELYAESDNESALKFYQKLGFSIEGCLKKYYKRATEDNYVDELILAMVFD